MSRISPPVLIAPMVDVLVFEKHRAQFQCRISGEGSSECPALVGCWFDTHIFTGFLLILCDTVSRFADFLVQW